MPIESKVIFYAGERYRLDLTLPNEDVTGWTIKLYMKTGNINSIAAKDASIDDGPSGKFSFQFERDDTKNLGGSTVPFDVWRTDPAAPNVLAIGEIELKAPVRPADDPA